MTERTATRRIGGWLALALGAAMFVVFPTLGMIELLAGMSVLGVKRATSDLAAAGATTLVFVFAVLASVGTNHMEYLFSVPIAIISSVTALILVRSAASARGPEGQVR